jgi:carbonic anhydrase
MKKLLQGIADWRKARTKDHAKDFAKLALGQAPDALLICCADSRVAPNVFASVEPGDLLVVRNVGNLVPRYAAPAAHRAGASVPAAIEFALQGLHVRDVIVCGHSECAAMRAIATGVVPDGTPHLEAWLRHGHPAREGLGPCPPGLEPHNHLSQRSVRMQLENLRTYPVVREAEAAGRLRLHAWWFDIGNAEVLDYDTEAGRYVLLDTARVTRLLARWPA